MGVTFCVLSVLMIVFNTLVLILGIVLSALGGLLIWGIPLLKKYVGSQLDTILKDIQSALAGQVDVKINADQILRWILDFGKPAGVGCLIVGIFLFAFAILGCCGACCKIKTLLIIYAVVVGVFLLITVVCCGVLGNKLDKITDTLGDWLKPEIKKNYKNLKDSGSSVVTFVMNFIHLQFKCCGVTNYKDFEGGTWKGQTTLTVAGVNIAKTIPFPITCCKFENYNLNNKTIITNCLINADPTDKYNNKNTGCMDKFTAKIKSPTKAMLAVMIIIILSEVALLAVTIILICTADSTIV